MRKLLLSGVALLALTGAAKADLITGQLSLFAVTELDTAARIIEFYSGNALPPVTIGSFAGVGPNPALVWQNTGSDVAWSNIGSGSDLFCGANCLFVTATAGTFSWFNVSSAAVSPTSDLEIFGAGVMSLTGFDPTPGTFSMSGQAGNFGAYSAWTAFTYIPNTVHVPGPLAGAGLPGLVAACMGLIALVRRRKAAVSRCS
jgi:hypothetical protein